MDKLNCLRCGYEHKDNGNCTAIGGFCTAVPAAYCKKLREYMDTGLTPERVAELAQADRDGRVVVLPCKVGDTVYRTFNVEGRKPVIVDVKMHNLLDIIHLLKLFGKSIFLARSEAEAALEKETYDAHI